MIAHRVARRTLWSAALACAAAGAAHAEAPRRYELDLEAGLAWQERNDIQSPNDATGTRFALDGVTGRGPFLAPRVQLAFEVAPRHELRFVVAPLRVDEGGTLGQGVSFQGQAFAPGAAEARFRFDSYRATWRTPVLDRGPWKVKLGATAKLRDAEVTLRQGGVTATRKDTGIVPLLHVQAEYRLDPRSRLALEGDALGGGRGRAIDLSLRYVRDLSPAASAFAGLRVLDGGADQSSVYSFARFHYLTAGLQFRF